MKIVLINSSPRKGGNSDVLCDQFAKGAVEAGHDVEKISLRDKNLSPCKACYYCRESHSCVIRDDMGEIFKKLLAADVIVLASPVYFYSLTAQMKILIDRCLVDYIRLTDKQFYYIITAAEPQKEAAEGTIKAFRGFLDCLPGAVEAGIVYGMGVWEKGEVYQHPSMEQAYEMGKRL